MGPTGLLISIILLIALSFFCSLAETAFVSAPEEKLFRLSQDGNKKAGIALKLVAKKDTVISIALLCDNMANVAASSLSAVWFADMFGEWDEIGILLSTIIMTILVFVFGEVFPKMIAVRQPTKFAMLFAPLLVLLSKVLMPVLFVMNKMTNIMVKILNIRDEDESEDANDTILDAVEMYHKKGALEGEEKDMLSGVLQMDDVDLKDTMTHRSDMFALDINIGAQAIVDEVMKTQFSKIPIYDKSDDNMLGVLHIRDLMGELYKNKDISKIDIRSILHEPWYLPGDASIRSHLQEFRERGNVLAFVVDEYGGVMGVVTLEDIIEEIVGDIKSNNEDVPNLCLHCDDGSFIIDAEMNLIEANENIGSNFENEEVSSIGGFVINEIEHIPVKDEEFDIDGYHFKVLETEANRVIKMSVKKNVVATEDIDNKKEDN